MQLSGVEIMASASKNNFRIVFAPKCHFREPNVCIDGGGTPLWGVPQQLFRLRQERESMGEVTPQKGGYPPYEAHGTNLTPIMGYPERKSRGDDLPARPSPRLFSVKRMVGYSTHRSTKILNSVAYRPMPPTKKPYNPWEIMRFFKKKR